MNVKDETPPEIVQLDGKTIKQYPLVCPDCGARMLLKMGRYGVFYGCVEYPRCSCAHGCHTNGKPFGIPVDKETRQARTEAHQAFDWVWRERLMRRSEAYAWLCKIMDLAEDEGHIGMFTKEQCEKLIQKVKAFSGLRRES
jgi:ssDNA-binding Zn-finger/Zn-ribbon topoisomerase 1